MRVLVLSESYPTPEHPGRAVFLEEQLRALAAAGVSPVVLFPRPSWPGVDSRRLEPRARRFEGRAWAPRADDPPVQRPDYFYVPRLRSVRAWSLGRLCEREIERVGPDLLHVHWFGPAATAGAAVARRTGLPLVITAHAGDVYRELDVPRLRRSALRAGTAASRIIAVAPHLAARLGSLPGLASKIRVVPNGVEESRFRPVAREEARGRLGWPTAGRVVLYAGQLVAAKGVLDLVEAFLALTADGMDRGRLRLVVAGTGPLAEQIGARLREALTGGAAQFCGWQDHERMADLLNAADVFVLPSYAEGNPVTVLESLCCGTPVIGTAIPALAEILSPPRDGALVPPGRPRELMQALHGLLTDPPDRNRIAAAAHARYGWTSVARRIVDVYAEARKTPH